MRKIKTILQILLSLVLLSSCNLASFLNEKLGLVAPSDRCFISFLDTEITNEVFTLDLGNDYNWNISQSITVTLDMLMEYDEFAAWIKSLDEQSIYSPIGLYDASVDNAVLSTTFVLHKDQPLTVAWNSPLRKIRVYANNGYELKYSANGPKYFDYYLPESVPYDENYELSFSTMKQDKGFNDFLFNLGDRFYRKYGSYVFEDGGYSCSGFVNSRYLWTDYGNGNGYSNYDQEILKTVTINKWTKCVYLGWRYGNPPITSITIHSKGETEESFVITLDGEYELLAVTWSWFNNDARFMEWYNSLQRPGYEKIGLGYESGQYASVSPNNEFWENLNYDRQDLYVIWKPLIKCVNISSNNGKNENSFTVEFDDYLTSDWLVWEDLTSYPGFLNWYEEQTYGDRTKLGLITNLENKFPELSPNGGSVYCHQNNNKEHCFEVYILWGEEFSSVKIYANNGTSESFTYEIGEPVKNFYLSFDNLNSNDFIKWYDGLKKTGYIQKGLSFSKDDNTIICNKYYGTTISSNTSTLYVVWGKLDPISKSNTSLYTNCYFGMQPGSRSSLFYNLRTNSDYTLERTEVKELKFISDNPDVVDVDDYGNLSALSIGKAKITMSVTDYYDNYVEKSVEVEVKDDIEFEICRSFDFWGQKFDCSADGKVIAGYGPSGIMVTMPNNGSFSSWPNAKDLDVSRSGDSIAVISEENEIYICPDVTASIYRRWYLVLAKNSSNGVLDNVGISDDGNTIVCTSKRSGNKDSILVLENVRKKALGTGDIKLQREEFDGSLSTVKMSSDGSVIVVGTSEGLWYSETAELSFMRYIEEPVGCLYLSTDKNTILYSVPYGDYYQINKLQNLSEVQEGLAYSNDLLYTSDFDASEDCTQILYNSRTGIDYFSTDQGKSWKGLQTNINFRVKLLDDSTLFGYVYQNINSAIYRYINN